MEVLHLFCVKKKKKCSHSPNISRFKHIFVVVVQGALAPQLPAGEGQAPMESEVPEDAMERLAHLEQLVVQLKELIRDKDAQLLQKDTELTSKDAQHKVSNRACLCLLCTHRCFYFSVLFRMRIVFSVCFTLTE